MCKEAKIFLEQLDSGQDVASVRKAMDEYAKTDPFMFSEMKGLSIARAVINCLKQNNLPARPPLLTVNEGNETAWRVTKGFVYNFEVKSVFDISDSDVLIKLGASVTAQYVPSRQEFTPAELNFHPEDISSPAVRLLFDFPE